MNNINNINNYELLMILGHLDNESLINALQSSKQ